MQYGSEEQEMGETTAISHTDRFKPWVSKTWPYSQTLVGLIQRRPWLSFGFGVVHHGLPKVYARSTETHVAAAGHAALSLVPALAGGDHSKLLLSLPTVLCHPCHHADVFVGLHCRSGVCSSFNPYCSGWSGVQQPPKDRCLSPAEDWSRWYEAETGSGWWRRGLAEQPPREMVWGSHQWASREATAPSHSSHILLSHPKTPDKPGALSCLSLPPANQR